MLKKITIMLCLCLSISTLCVNADNSNLNSLVKEYNQNVKAQSVKIRNCTPYKDRAFQIYGIKGGSCHYATAFYEYGGTSKPLTDCYAPMSVMREIADNMVKGLNDNSLSVKYNSSTDPLNRYCKSINTTIKVR